MVTKSEIFDMMERFGIRHDDKMTVHSALRSVGGIEGGADGLIDAFREYLDAGLLIVPTHTWDNVTRDHPFFDVRTTVPCIGTMARVAAFRPDGVRSLHPTHSVAAFGKGAADYVRGEEKCATPAPVWGCLSRLYEEHGKILLVGVTHSSNTYLHAVDERLNIPDRLRPDAFTITIRDAEGHTLQSPPFHPHMNDTSDYYPNYKKALEYTGAVTYGQLGSALVYCCDVRKTTDTVAMLWSKTDHNLYAAHEDVPESYYRA